MTALRRVSMLLVAVICGALLTGPQIVTWAYLSVGAYLISSQSRPTNAQAWQAISYTQAAQRLTPNDPAILRQLAQAYLLVERYDEATLALERAYQLAPKSLVIQRDLAVAYTLAGDRRAAEQLWLQQGMTPDHMASMGDSQIRASRYADARMWYRLAALHDESLAPELLARQVMSAALSGDPAPDLREMAIQAGLIGVVGDDGLRVEGSALRWLTETPEYDVYVGTPLNFPRADDVGTFWWQGEAAMVIDVRGAGEYRIDAALCECAPPPVEMRIGVDGSPLAGLALGRGDGSVSTTSISVYLEPGLHTVHLWFDNNAVVDGIDRNAKVYWVAVSPVDIDP